MKTTEEECEQESVKCLLISALPTGTSDDLSLIV